jgi:hypothetical protein
MAVPPNVGTKARPYTYELSQRVKWFERNTGTWHPALICKRERRHDGVAYYKVFSTTGSNVWMQQEYHDQTKHRFS